MSVGQSSHADARSVPLLHAALHWRVEPPFARAAASWLDRAALAGRLAGAQFARATSRRGFEIEAVFVISTILDGSFTASADAVACFEDAFAASAGRRLHGIVNAYLCAGWGFALRYVMSHTALRRLALCIVDLDLHDMEWQREHPLIGRSGFGLSTLLFQLPPAPGRLPECGGPYTNSAFSEFVMALRAHGLREGASPTFLPFTQTALHAMAQRLLADGQLAPNRYDTLGHCFGSDPWIGVIEWFSATSPTRRVRVLAGAIGFNGYYTLSDIDVQRELAVEFRCVDGTRLSSLSFDPDDVFLPGVLTS